MDFSKELSVKGFCFRHYQDNKEVACKVKECGLDKIDLSGCQLNFRNPEEHVQAIMDFLNAGVEIVGIGAIALNGQPGDRELFEFCRKARCSTISINGAPETFFAALEQAEKFAEEYDVRLAIHNHGGTNWLGNSQMLKHVLANSSDRVGLCIDTAWCIQAGENPFQWLEQFEKRIYAVHFKDFTFDSKGQYHDVVVGEGALDLSMFIQRLQEISFEGPAIIEYEANPENPVPALQNCVNKMREVIHSVFADTV